jgi:hypothetical protein
MCNITNVTDLKEAVIYKVVFKDDKGYISPYARTAFGVGIVSNQAVAKFVSWADLMEGLISGFTDLTDAKMLFDTKIRTPQAPVAKLLVKVTVAATDDQPIMAGTGAGMGRAWEHTKILAAPHVISIEEIESKEGVDQGNIISREFPVHVRWSRNLQI